MATEVTETQNRPQQEKRHGVSGLQSRNDPGTIPNTENSRMAEIRQVPLIFHLLAFATLMCACLAVNSEVDSGMFLYGAGGAALLGHCASVYMRSKQKTSRTVEILIFGLCLLVYMRVMLTPYEFAALRSGGFDSPQVRFAQLLVWMECMRSFTITSNEAALFTGVTCIASIGLIATDNGAPGIVTYFVLYLFFMISMLTRYTFEPKERDRACPPLKGILNQLRLPVIVTAVVMVAGVLCTHPVRLISAAALGKAIPKISAGGAVRLPSVKTADTSMPIMQGSAHLSDMEVLTVKSKRPCYWRGSVYSNYSGTVWEQDSRARLIRPSTDPKHVDPTRRLEQTFTVLPGLMTSELYGAAEAISMTRKKLLHSRFYRDQFNCWTSGRMLPDGFQYQVISVLPEDSPVKLARAGTRYPKDISRVYLQKTTLTKDNRVRRLALRVTRDCVNPYEKALALESYLSRNYTYDLSPPRPPRGGDVVEFFLFDSQRGYCIAFASAMVMMLRELGIPARVATGFAAGRFDNSRGVYSVLEKDAHAWAEAYFPNCGWVTFDPSGAEDERQQSFWSIVVVETRKTVHNMLGSRPWLPIGVLLLLVIGCLARPDIATVRIGLNRGVSTDPRRRAVFKRYEAMCRAASRSGIRRGMDQTPTEYTQLLRVSTALSTESSDLIERLTRDFESVKYGGHEPDDALLAEMRKDLKALNSHLPWYRRTRPRQPEMKS
jgi:hypothetical protein